jgi:hypothetical protein
LKLSVAGAWAGPGRLKPTDESATLLVGLERLKESGGQAGKSDLQFVCQGREAEVAPKSQADFGPLAGASHTALNNNSHVQYTVEA